MGYIPSIGEIVRIRQWDDMIQEFGTRGNRFDDDDRIVIPCKGTFVPEMKNFVVKNTRLLVLKTCCLLAILESFLLTVQLNPLYFLQICWNQQKTMKK